MGAHVFGSEEHGNTSSERAGGGSRHLAKKRAYVLNSPICCGQQAYSAANGGTGHPPRWITEVPFDNTSVIRTVLDRFVGRATAGFYLTERDRVAPNLEPFLTLPTPRTDFAPVQRPKFAPTEAERRLIANMPVGGLGRSLAFMTHVLPGESPGMPTKNGCFCVGGPLGGCGTFSGTGRPWCYTAMNPDTGEPCGHEGWGGYYDYCASKTVGGCTCKNECGKLFGSRGCGAPGWCSTERNPDGSPCGKRNFFGNYTDCCLSVEAQSGGGAARVATGMPQADHPALALTESELGAKAEAAWERVQAAEVRNIAESQRRRHAMIARGVLPGNPHETDHVHYDINDAHERLSSFVGQRPQVRTT